MRISSLRPSIEAIRRNGQPAGSAPPARVTVSEISYRISGRTRLARSVTSTL